MLSGILQLHTDDLEWSGSDVVILIGFDQIERSVECILEDVDHF